jgi:hypothetical protein
MGCNQYKLQQTPYIGLSNYLKLYKVQLLLIFFFYFRLLDEGVLTIIKIRLL